MSAIGSAEADAHPSLSRSLRKWTEDSGGRARSVEAGGWRRPLAQAVACGQRPGAFLHVPTMPPAIHDAQFSLFSRLTALLLDFLFQSPEELNVRFRG